VRAVPVLLLPPAHVPADVWRPTLWVHRDDIGRDPRLRLRAARERLRRHGCPVAGWSGSGIVRPADNTVPVGRKLDVRRPGGHRRQRDGPRGRSDAARRRLEHDGMSRDQVNDMSYSRK